MASLSGTTIDKYELQEEVGHGGMAVVYRGRDRVLDREVAVKVLHPHLADREESRLRLQREAIAVAKLRHENILEIYDYSGPEADESYIVTEFIHGPTLREWLEKEHEPRPAVAAMIVHRLCLALWQAHKVAIVHRDIKPENVMIRMEDGSIKLMDFGIAQIIDNKKLTLTGQLIGSPAYMAPELISGRPLDTRTDLFSLGILLYQLATGELPFNGRNPHEVLTRIADGEYPPASQVCSLVDRDLEAIIDRALALNPDERFQSVETFAKELEEYLGEMGLEPASSELCEYFRDPDEYVTELDARVCAALLEQADKAGAAGSTARAIRLLGRVVEIDPDHSGARTMLGRFKARERRSRQLLLGGASLALAGLVGAGYMLMPPDTGARGREVASKDGASLTARGDGDAQDGNADAGPGDDDEADPTGGPSPASGGVIAGGGGDVAVPGTDSGPTGETGEPGETGETGETKVAVGRPPIRLRPPRPRPDKEDAPVPCKITVDGVPEAWERDVMVTVDGRRVDLEGHVAQAMVPPEGVDVRVDHKRLSGRKRVVPDNCETGATVLTRPKKGDVEFLEIPSDTVVHCDHGCGEGKNGENYVAKAFPSLDIADTGGQVITVTFRHLEYEDQEESFRVRPGPNRFRVKLKHR